MWGVSNWETEPTEPTQLPGGSPATRHGYDACVALTAGVMPMSAKRAGIRGRLRSKIYFELSTFCFTLSFS